MEAWCVRQNKSILLSLCLAQHLGSNFNTAAAPVDEDFFGGPLIFWSARKHVTCPEVNLPLWCWKVHEAHIFRPQFSLSHTHSAKPLSHPFSHGGLATARVDCSWTQRTTAWFTLRVSMNAAGSPVIVVVVRHSGHFSVPFPMSLATQNLQCLVFAVYFYFK